MRDRASYAFASVSVAAIVGMGEGRINHVALAFGGIAAQPWRNPEIGDLLTGRAPSDALFAKTADILLQPARSQGDNQFKIPLLRRALMATLREVAGMEVTA